VNARSRTPAVVQVLLVVAALLTLGFAVLLAPGRDVAPPAGALLGEQELVRITGPNGHTLEAVACIDTGASASSLDEDIAEHLGSDLDAAETVTVASSLGREERPVVQGALQGAGLAKPARFTVSDRSERSNPVLLGRAELTGRQVQVGQRLLTTPGEQRAPSALAMLLSQAPALPRRSCSPCCRWRCWCASCRWCSSPPSVSRTVRTERSGARPFPWSSRR
jgi:hypothetical protein